MAYLWRGGGKRRNNSTQHTQGDSRTTLQQHMAGTGAARSRQDDRGVLADTTGESGDEGAALVVQT
jgi:hypothetical protein